MSDTNVRGVPVQE